MTETVQAAPQSFEDEIKNIENQEPQNIEQTELIKQNPEIAEIEAREEQAKQAAFEAQSKTYTTIEDMMNGGGSQDSGVKGTPLPDPPEETTGIDLHTDLLSEEFIGNLTPSDFISYAKNSDRFELHRDGQRLYLGAIGNIVQGVYVSIPVIWSPALTKQKVKANVEAISRINEHNLEGLTFFIYCAEVGEGNVYNHLYFTIRTSFENEDITVKLQKQDGDNKTVGRKDGRLIKEDIQKKIWPLLQENAPVIANAFKVAVKEFTYQKIDEQIDTLANFKKEFSNM